MSIAWSKLIAKLNMSSPFLLLLSLFLCMSPHFNFNMADPGIKVKLMHIDNPASPYRRSYRSVEHKYQVWEEMSQRRFAQIFYELEAEKVKVNTDGETIYHPELKFGPYGSFLARMDIGVPPKQQYLFVDTGSTITWANCTPSEYTFPLSITGKKVLCSDYQCGWIPYVYRTCGVESHKPCTFLFGYVSVKQLIKGELLSDTFSFLDPASGSTLFTTSVAFGCSEQKRPLVPGFTAGAGVVGLSNGRASLASQLGSSFSYCFGNIYDELSPYNSLTLGRGDLLGKSTPILNTTNRIFVTLKSISVGGEVLDLDPYMFRRYGYTGGAAVDTGSTTTYLMDEAYQAVKDKLAEKMKPDSSDAFCFLYLRAHLVPVVQFEFEGGAVLSLGAEALFGRLDPSAHMYCFRGIKPSSVRFGEKSVSQFMSLIGINAQQHHNIGFDLKNSLMYIQEASCDFDETD